MRFVYDRRVLGAVLDPLVLHYSVAAQMSHCAFYSSSASMHDFDTPADRFTSGRYKINQVMFVIS